MSPEITPNTFLTCTSTSTGSNPTPIQTPETTIFFISGNPGLIGYYHPFLSLLSKYLTPENENDNENDSPSFQIYGCSLGGFELNDDKSPSSHESKVQKSQSDDLDLDLDLEDQIHFVQGKLTTLMGNRSIAARSKQKVILIGHSVGAYIAMEILRRHREASSGERDGEGGEFDIIGGAMLFPTVLDIAASASGRKLTTLLSIIPRFAAVVGFFARLLTLLLPASILRALVRFVMNDPPAHALDATCSFLRSSGGVRQALHMAADEMRTITSDKWSDDVWGAATAREPLTKLFFYFGRNDHWVADQTRDEIIAVRGRKEGQGPTMLVCEEDLPHAFCLKHSDIMARKTAGMIKQIVGGEST